MPAKPSQRIEAIVHALMLDEHRAARHELFMHGVNARQIDSLYPHDPSALPEGLRAYMKSGGRITLDHPAGVHDEIAEAGLALNQQFSRDQIDDAADFLGIAPAFTMMNSIVAYPKATFSALIGSNAAVGTHKSQAVNLVTRLNWAMFYARPPVDLEAAANYLSSLVDTYLPDLLAGQ